MCCGRTVREGHAQGVRRAGRSLLADELGFAVALEAHARVAGQQGLAATGSDKFIAVRTSADDETASGERAVAIHAGFLAVTGDTRSHVALGFPSVV